MKNSITILVIEDESSISHFITAILESNEYRVLKAYNGKDAIEICSAYCPDVILLDLGLPDMDGVNVLAKLREWSTIPVIVVSARGNEADKVKALDLGADDYVTKPFGSNELLARVRTALRHSSIGQLNPVIEIHDLVIDNDKRQVFLFGEEVHLTPIEYKILSLLAKNIGKVLTIDNIMREVWGPYVDESNSLRVNMANIRRKIEKNPAQPKYIRTEIGVGYRMIEQ